MSDPEEITLEITEDLTNTRLDKALAVLRPDLSRSRIKDLIIGGQVSADGKKLKTPSLKVSQGLSITIMIPDLVDADPEPENIPLDVVYEDDDLLVVNKSYDMVVHPAVGNLTGTLVNALLYHCGDSLSGIGGVKRPGIVHRLDKETSGVMVVAKNDHAHQGLSDQVKDRTLHRVYTAFTWRAPNLIKGCIDEPIGRHPTNRIKMAIMKSSGRESKTHYLVREKYGEAAAKIECKLESGRTHQIRVHMQHLKNPIIGDPLYGLVAQESRAILEKTGYEEAAIEGILGFPRQALHAQKIGFIHPQNGEEMAFEADLPDDLRNLENYLKSVL